MSKVGDPPGFEIKETCNKCGKIYRAIWHYSESLTSGDGYAERLCCKGET